jgi:hypothetical protein
MREIKFCTCTILLFLIDLMADARQYFNSITIDSLCY